MTFMHGAVLFCARLLVWAMTGQWISADSGTPPRTRTTPTRDQPACRRPTFGYDGDSIEVWVDLYVGLRSFAYIEHPICHALLRNT